MEHMIHSIFSCPIYMAKRDSELDLIETKEIRKIIDEEGMSPAPGNFTSNNSNIFNGKLKKIKEYCEHHIQNYVKEIIIPKEELDFYITQSWANVTKPGGHHHHHNHPNSIISGVFYISAEETDTITFFTPNQANMSIITIEHKEWNVWNSPEWTFPIQNNVLILFPSWLLHRVDPNEKATTDRISISFNTFVRGTLGSQKGMTELILK